MSISKADYDELVRLRSNGATSIRKLKSGKSFGMIPPLGEFAYRAKNLSFDFDKLNIAAAIAEYERAQEVNHE